MALLQRKSCSRALGPGHLGLPAWCFFLCSTAADIVEVKRLAPLVRLALAAPYGKSCTKVPGTVSLRGRKLDLLKVFSHGRHLRRSVAAAAAW